MNIDADGPVRWMLSRSIWTAICGVAGAVTARQPPTAKAEDLDGVMVFNPLGKAIGFFRLPERCANLEFGGPSRNRLYMASCHSLYSVYVEAHGAV